MDAHHPRLRVLGGPPRPRHRELGGRGLRRGEQHREPDHPDDPEPAPTGADVSVAVTGTPATVAQLANVSYATDVTNAGPLAADGVSLVFDTKVIRNLGSLASGATASKVLGVSWGLAGDRTVKATVSSTTADPTAANNSETEHTSVS